ncbi:hypothetical protein N7470_001315 [Penicillium chermesinum]|nr:hypothetical protein N7470_001315 [Penicillium chermesinum]
MKVRSSMSISINAFGNLWGLISCHSYGERGMRVSFPLRKLCRLVGDTVARGIERISYATSLQTRKLMEAIPQHTNPASYIAASSDELLQSVGADYGALSIGGESKFFGGRSMDSGLQEARALVDYLRRRQVTAVIASHDVAKDFPDFPQVRKLKNISGLLCVPLSTSTDQFLVFFRRGQLTTITWAGNPHENAKAKQQGGKKALTPRESFKEWVETVLTQSRAWSDADIVTATNFGLIYGKFIQVWNQKDSVGKDSRLTRLLLANSAHEARTPLNAVINYLEIALEGTLDDATREILIKSHSASKSLIYVINDLLDLTNLSHEASKRLIKDEPFDLKSTFRQATDMLAGEAERKGLSYSSTVHPDLPISVIGDQRRVRQVFLNLVSNAIQNTSSGSVRAQISPSISDTAIEGYVTVEMAVSDTGSGISEERLDIMFGELEQLSDDINSIENREDLKAKRTVEPEKGVLGLGLALAARMAHNMHGRLSVKSEEGKGSVFRILLQFRRSEDVVPTVQVSSHEDTNMSEIRKKFRKTEETDAGKIIAGDSIPDMSDTMDASGNPGDGDESDQSKHPKSESPPAHDPVSGSADGRSQTQSEEDRSDNSAQWSSSHSKSRHPLLPSHLHKSRGTSYATTDPHTTTTPSEGASSLFTPSTGGSTEPSNQSAGSAKLHILVAEDDPINSTILQKRLESLGHTVQLTQTGGACVDAFCSDPQIFDLVLMDIQVSRSYSSSAQLRALRDAHHHYRCPSWTD